MVQPVLARQPASQPARCRCPCPAPACCHLPPLICALPLPHSSHVQCGWVTVFSSVVLGFFLLSIEEIGVSIEVQLPLVAGLLLVGWMVDIA